MAEFRKRVWRGISGEQPELPDYAQRYHEVLRTLLETIDPPAPGDARGTKAYADAKQCCSKTAEEVGWGDLMLLHHSIVRLLPFHALKLQVAELRARLEASGTPALTAGLATKLDTVGPNDIDALRSEAEMLVCKLWQTRMARDSRDRMIAELRRTAFGLLLVIVLLIWGVAKLLDKTELYFLIISAGMLGALISVLRRLQAASADTPTIDYAGGLSALSHERRAAVLSLFVGSVFAIVLYVIFVAGLSDLAGKLAPQFVNQETTPPGGKGVFFHFFVDDIGPRTGADFAKVLIWSFIAGFSEKLVPDVLDRLANREKK